MYAMPPAAHCSCFAVLREDGVLWGRNSDFLPQLETANRRVIYRFSEAAYDFSGHTTSFVQIEDGVNRQVPIASAQTFLLADRSGSAALVECCSQGTAVRYASTDHPALWSVNAFHLSETAPYQGRPEDDWGAAERWHTLDRVLTRQGACLTPYQAIKLLSGRYGFLCQYDRTQGKDTVWSVVCDLAHGRLWRAEGNPARVPFQLDRKFSFLSARP